MEEISVRSYDGTWLAATLKVPKNPKGIFIGVHGSQLQTREGSLDVSRRWIFPEGGPQRNLFRDIGERLDGLGVGSLCYDKRASGTSEGTYAKTTLDDLAQDAIAIFHEASRRFPGVPVIMIGQSEGTWTVPRACELGLKPAAIILQGAVAWTARRTFDFQRERAAAPFLKDLDGELSRKFPFYSALYQAMFLGDFWDKFEKGAKEYEVSLRSGYRAVQPLDIIRQYDRCDIRKVLAGLKIPVHYLTGELDNNVPPAAVRELEAWAKDEGFAHVRFHWFPKLEHSFRECAPGENFIDAAKKPISKEYLDLLAEVVAAVVKAGNN